MPPRKVVIHEGEFDEIEGGDLLDAAELLEEHEKRAPAPERKSPREPLLTILFKQWLDEDQVQDVVLRDFIEHVLTPLADALGIDAAKGGDFARQQQRKYEDALMAGHPSNMRDPADYSHDQTMRAHLLNGMLPALRIARNLHSWDASPLRHWSEEAERLFIAGYMLHDYTKLSSVKNEFAQADIPSWQSPDERRIPVMMDIFAKLCVTWGLDDFLSPLGGARANLQDLLYVAHNTQQQKETIRLFNLLPEKRASQDVLKVAATVSRLADLMAYVAKTPRAMVTHESIRTALQELAFDSTRKVIIARLTCHHVADNRGVLLNFIHEAVRESLQNEWRLPLLYAPSGIVYLEHHQAPPIPDMNELIATTIRTIQDKARDRLLTQGKGARRGNVNLQIDDSYSDYFSLTDILYHSPKIVFKHIRSNKSAARLAPVQENNWPGAAHLPPLPGGSDDARLDQIAEWAGFLEIQLRDRLGDESLDLAAWLLPRLGIEDLLPEFRALEADPGARRAGGIKYWWFWAAAHVLQRQALSPEAVEELLESVSAELVAALPAELPASAQIHQTKWDDLAHYLARVLTLGGVRVNPWTQPDETTRYVNAKRARGGGAVCAICGDAYDVTQPNETAVAFQPGVYTSRVKIAASSNVRSLCSVCALEQLLRQLFVVNLDSGRNVEEQRARYLALYPSYFFTPETMRIMRNFNAQLTDLRLGAGDLRRILGAGLTNSTAVQRFVTDGEIDAKALLPDSRLWTHLQEFMLKPADMPPSKRVLRYGVGVDPTFYMLGLRNFDKPSDVESWILPTFTAFVLALALDLKVVVSEGSGSFGTAPLITETDELAETLWFDGVHPAVRAVIDIGRDSLSDRLHVDEVLPALARLTAAYLIHLDTEYDGRDEYWNRFPPLAHALAESPLYVFHYLFKQEREDSERKPLTPERVHRYLSYALLFSDKKGKAQMSIARELVVLYRGFYRADNFKNSNSVLRPLNVLADALLNAAVLPSFREPDALVEVAYGELYKFMDRVGKGLADGRFPKGVSATDRDMHMRAFCDKFVRQLFIKDLNQDVGALRGKPLNLIKNACEGIYRELQYAEWAERGRDQDETTDAEDVE